MDSLLKGLFKLISNSSPILGFYKNTRFHTRFMNLVSLHKFIGSLQGLLRCIDIYNPIVKTKLPDNSGKAWLQSPVFQQPYIQKF